MSAPALKLREPLRFSHLKAFGTLSPAHYRYGTEPDETTSMERGSAVHALALGNKPVLAYPGVRRGKEWEAFKARHDSSLIVTEKEYERALAMANAIKAHKYGAAALEGIREQTLLWDFAGLPCRGTMDVRTKTRVTDIKTSRTAKPGWFDSIAVRNAYHAQLCWYAEGIRTLGLGNPTELVIVAVESSAPYVCTVYRLTERAMEAGDRLWRSWIERLRVCLDSDSWPGYSEAIVDLDVPDDRGLITFGDAEDGDEAEESRDAA